MSGILQISEAVSLALHSMVLIAKTKGMLTTGEIADTTKASHAHLSKVLQRLSKADLVNSVRGPSGGFYLARPANTITLLEIYETMEGPIEIPKCLLKNNDKCLYDQCMFNGLLENLTVQFKNYLASHTLDDVTKY
jgi:Rrf2 family protein